MEHWTISELAERVSAALAVNFEGVANGRVRDTPDLRAIRYYTTLGLLDRPAEMRGRTAFYGRRHLQQLVAIKRLQAQGLSLAEVQQRLLGMGNRQLERLADIKVEVRGSRPPATHAVASVHQKEASASDTGTNSTELRPEFWRTAPSSTPDSATQPAGIPVASPETLTLVPLAAGVYLGIGAGRTMTADDVQALRAAAEPLWQLLNERRLVRPERGSHGQTAPDSEAR